MSYYIFYSIFIPYYILYFILNSSYSINRPDSYMERKRRLSTRARMQKREARSWPFESQTLRFRRERSGPERGPPKYHHTSR